VWTNDLLTFTNDRIKEQIPLGIAPRGRQFQVGVRFGNTVLMDLTQLRLFLSGSGFVRDSQ
jgi:hypothetical protein